MCLLHGFTIECVQPDEMILALVLFLVLSQNDSNFTENADMALMVDFCLLEFVLQMGLHFVL